MIISNIDAVHMNPVTWPEPEVFKPSRHLTAEGKFFKKDEYIPFCIGEGVLFTWQEITQKLYIKVFEWFHMVFDLFKKEHAMGTLRIHVL